MLPFKLATAIASQASTTFDMVIVMCVCCTIRAMQFHLTFLFATWLAALTATTQHSQLL